MTDRFACETFELDYLVFCGKWRFLLPISATFLDQDNLWLHNRSFSHLQLDWLHVWINTAYQTTVISVRFQIWLKIHPPLAAMSKPRYTIITHECRGRIEPVRYMLELKGVPYDEVIVNDANQDQMKRGLLEVLDVLYIMVFEQDFKPGLEPFGCWGLAPSA